MKRITLIRKITAAARASGKDLTLVREGGNHSVLRCGKQDIVVPRHREINEYTALGIMKDLADELGKDWWK